MTDKRPFLLISALGTVGLLIVLLALAVFLFGDGASSGPNQFAILVCATVAAVLGRLGGTSWEELGKAVRHGVSIAVPALFILLAVGALIGTWAMSGTIVAMIYYGLEFLNLNYFYVSTCVISAFIAVSIGSSWTVIGTLGVGMIGIADGVGLSPVITAGAVISGAYFGDKTSPLSDATNLAAAVAETPLMEHIRYTMWTSIPTLILAILGFLAIDLSTTADISVTAVDQVKTVLSDMFNVSPWALSPLVVVLALVIARQPAFLAIITGALFGGVLAVILQPDIVLTSVAAPGDVPTWLTMIEAVWRALSDGFSISSGFERLDNLLSRGGMASMLGTVWLILCALSFGAILERTGMIQALLQGLIALARTTGRLFAVVAMTCFSVNVLAADQYIAIALPGRLFAPEFRNRGLAPKYLSRLIGDSATVTSALVPWNTCGAYITATLGVGTIYYLPYCFFNIANPIISVMVGVLGIGIVQTVTNRDDRKAEEEAG